MMISSTGIQFNFKCSTYSIHTHPVILSERSESKDLFQIYKTQLEDLFFGGQTHSTSEPSALSLRVTTTYKLHLKRQQRNDQVKSDLQNSTAPQGDKVGGMTFLQGDCSWEDIPRRAYRHGSRLSATKNQPIFIKTK